ncbi:hypothetical protein BJ322DRAFT_752103 [Thelephora terrestris]|uniref:Uncharacterized protein n=1 Tax=Thelephora terrestris TaxID=56493 RepID=A0A9P6HF19_9AGAM|nr:hypothetical protein BJ322DRAFT_752103 [Thelephora terrestris]
MAPRIITHGLSGLGPRNAQYLVNLALLLLSSRDRLANAKQSGVDFKLHFTVFEKQSQAGTGNAFQTNCDAAINTGITGLPAIRGLANIDPLFVNLANHAKNIATRLESATTEILSDLQKRNPAVAALLKKALRLDGTVDTSVACTTRGELGRLLFANTLSALDYVRKNMPELIIEIRYNHQVTGVDFTDPRKPRLLVSKEGEAPTSYEFDFVTLAHGTSLVSPVSIEVGAKAYSLTPNHDSLKEYLQSQGLLDVDGYILPGKSIALTGVSLGAYDYATLLLPFIRGFRLSDSSPGGFEFDPAIAGQYRGLLTLISRSLRGPSPPRLAPNQTWKGKVSLLSTEEMHALRLHRNSDWLSPSYELLRASVAASVGKLPNGVEIERTVSEHMQLYSAENDDFLVDGATISETALLRAGFVAFSTGSGLEADPALAEQSLVEKAPFTRAGRLGWPMFSSSGSEISLPTKMDTPDNAAFYKSWDQLHHFISASPVILQNAVASLFRHGVATHQSASFDQIGLALSSRKITLGGREFDALLAPKTISREADPVLASLEGKVKEIYEGVPEYGKGMYLQTIDGTPINVFEVGMGGWGRSIRNGDGRKHVVGEQWNDTNNYHAAGVFGTNHALLTLILSLATIITPNDSPLDIARAFYEATFPPLRDFRLEIRRFEGIWRNVQERLVFVKLCAELAAGDPVAFASSIEHASTADRRNTFMSGQELAFRIAYANEIEKVSDFDPPKFPPHFERRFTAYTTPQLEAILDGMFAVIEADN